MCIRDRLVVDWCCWAPNRLDADMASEQLLANLLAQEGGVMSTCLLYTSIQHKRTDAEHHGVFPFR